MWPIDSSDCKKAGNAMKCTAEEVIQYVEEENVKFIRLAFCDVYGQQKTCPSCRANCGGRSPREWPLTPRPLPVSAARCARISSFARTPPLWQASPGVRKTGGWCGCSATLPGRTGPSSRPIPAICCSRPSPMPKAWAIPSPSARRWNSICSRPMKTASPLRSPMTTPDTWTLPRRTRAKTSAGKSA